MTDRTPATLGLDDLGLTVGALEASRAFYIYALGRRQFGGNPGYPSAYVTDGAVKLTLLQQQDEGANFDRRANIGLHHTALKLTDRATLDTLFARIHDWPGVEVDVAPELSGKGPKVHFMIREPGGTRLEFSYDPH